MKREQLKELGLSEEQIGSVMALHGATVNELNSNVAAAEQQVNQYKEQLDANQTELDSLKKAAEGNEELTTQLSDLQEKYDQAKADSESKIAEIKKTSAIELALTQAGARNIKAAKALLDSEKLELTDEGIKGLDEQLNTLKESDGYLFEGETTPPQNPEQKKATFQGNPSNAVPPNDETAQMIAAMTSDLVK
ncbi:phage scaffolding protein [Paenibacillus sp. 3LSP]|uniref:phage scaffolding protein n=1 Tax=Bacilli TaxID=91061 RepID=UPI0028FD76DC|nr:MULTISPECIES: phage scaffolding protein [Bacilli]MDU0319175.1 phage scaffolding protein [Enterococcus sp. 2STP]MDU0328802.1 phage scaffolding protein [Paenibacillus sp. 3LSP]MDU0335234.1 phage scaffolding protein [Enterococcus sp. 2CBP]MDU0350641.1 phage scaffolding protein [Enterococcus sp. 3MOLP]